MVGTQSVGQVWVSPVKQGLRRLQSIAEVNATCGCHIGYIHRDDFALKRIYGENVLERIPVNWPGIDPEMTRPLLYNERDL